MASHNTTYLVSISGIAALGGFLFGFDVAVISGTIGMVKQQYQLSSLYEGWFVSCALVGSILGVSFAGYLSDRFGRKKILVLSAMLFLISAYGCMQAESFSTLVLYRLLGGVGVGIASMLSPLYLSEMSPAYLRGRMVCLYQLAVTVGILFAYFSNAWVLSLSEDIALEHSWLQRVLQDETWRAMFGMEIVPALMFLALLSLIPESIRWLVQAGRATAALPVLTRMTDAAAAHREIDRIRQTTDQRPGKLAELWQPGLRRALALGVLIPFMVQFSGINAVIYYGPEIFAKAGFTLGDSLGGQVTVGIANVIFTLVAIWKIDQWGRRKLFLIGICGTVSLLLLIGLCFQSGHHQSFLLLALILAYVSFFSVSLGPVHWTVPSEIYPNRVRGRAMSIATFNVGIATAIVGQVFPWLLNQFGPAYSFWFFAVSSACLFAVIWRIMPETKNQSLEDIEALWRQTGRHRVAAGTGDSL